MNKIKKTTLIDRLKDALRAFRGKPAKGLNISLGVEVKSCKDCEREDCSKCVYRVELEKLIALPGCNECGAKGKCDFEPKLGELVRLNCPLFIPLAAKGPNVSRKAKQKPCSDKTKKLVSCDGCHDKECPLAVPKEAKK